MKKFEFVSNSDHAFLLEEAADEQKEPEKSEKAKDMVHLAFLHKSVYNSKNHRNCPHL